MSRNCWPVSILPGNERRAKSKAFMLDAMNVKGDTEAVSYYCPAHAGEHSGKKLAFVYMGNVPDWRIPTAPTVGRC
jgi:hypothetical protein